MYNYVFYGYAIYKVYEYFDFVILTISSLKVVKNLFFNKNIEKNIDINIDWIYIDNEIIEHPSISLLVSSDYKIPFLEHK